MSDTIKTVVELDFSKFDAGIARMRGECKKAADSAEQMFMGANGAVYFKAAAEEGKKVVDQVNKQKVAHQGNLEMMARSLMVIGKLDIGIKGLSIGTDLWRGDIAGAAAGIKELPFGIGQIAKGIEDIIGKWTGWTDEIERSKQQMKDVAALTELSNKNAAASKQGGRESADFQRGQNNQRQLVGKSGYWAEHLTTNQTEESNRIARERKAKDDKDAALQTKKDFEAQYAPSQEGFDKWRVSGEGSKAIADANSKRPSKREYIPGGYMGQGGYYADVRDNMSQSDEYNLYAKEQKAKQSPAEIQYKKRAAEIDANLAKDMSASQRNASAQRRNQISNALEGAGNWLGGKVEAGRSWLQEKGAGAATAYKDRYYANQSSMRSIEDERAARSNYNNQAKNAGIDTTTVAGEYEAKRQKTASEHEYNRQQIDITAKKKWDSARSVGDKILMNEINLTKKAAIAADKAIEQKEQKELNKQQRKQMMGMDALVFSSGLRSESFMGGDAAVGELKKLNSKGNKYSPQFRGN